MTTTTDHNNFESFVNNCCSGEETECFYTCEQVDQKLRTKANAGITYNKFQINAMIEELRALTSYLQAQQTRMLTGEIVFRPVATPDNKGVVYYDSDEDDLSISTGNSAWLQIQQKLSSGVKTSLEDAITNATDIDELKTVLFSILEVL